MPSIWGPSGSAPYDLEDCKVGVWVGDGTYSNMTDVGAVQMLMSSFEVSSKDGTGDASIVDTQSRIRAGAGTLRFLGLNQRAVAVMTGRTMETSGSGSTLVNRTKFTAAQMAYFGICGRTSKTPTGGDTHIFAAKCIINEGFQMQAEYDEYITVEIPFRILPDHSYNYGGVSEVQTVTITGSPTGGTFTLTFRGETTSAIAYNAAASAVQTALRALDTIGSAGVTVSGSGGGPYTVTFADDLAETELELMTASGALLTGGTSPAVAVTEATPGEDYEPTIFEVIEHASWAAITLPPA